MDEEINFNPSGRRDNCGYCSIAKALYEKTRTLQTADDLYEQMLHHLHLERLPDGRDPISRMLFLPTPNPDSIPIPTSHDALNHAGRSGAQYQLHRVAESLGVVTSLESSWLKELQRFIAIACESGTASRFPQLAKVRAEELNSPRPRVAVDKVEENCKTILARSFILGIDRGNRENHFINLRIDRTGSFVAYDAQNRSFYDARTLRLMGEFKALVSVR